MNTQGLIVCITFLSVLTVAGARLHSAPAQPSNGGIIVENSDRMTVVPQGKTRIITLEGHVTLHRADGQPLPLTTTRDGFEINGNDRQIVRIPMDVSGMQVRVTRFRTTFEDNQGHSLTLPTPAPN